MRIARVTIEGITTYSPSRNYVVDTPKNKDEASDAYDERCWRNHLHTTPDGDVFIPPMAFKFAIASAAKRRGDKIAGRRGATYTKYFESGIVVADGLRLGFKATDPQVRCEAFSCHSTGTRGPGSRVWRRFPMIDQWGGTFDVHVLDGVITEDIFEKTMEYTGIAVGVGRFRPENGGLNGRFSVKKIEWIKE